MKRNESSAIFLAIIKIPHEIIIKDFGSLPCLSRISMSVLVVVYILVILFHFHHQKCYLFFPLHLKVPKSFMNYS